MNNYKANQLTEQWLKDNGFNQKTFNATRIDVLRAMQAANEMLNEHSAFLSTYQKNWLSDFLRRAGHKKLCQRLTATQCKDVLNCKKSINRKLFKQYRQLGK